SVNSVWMDRIGLHGAERLQQLAESSPQIRLMCCGHVHHEFHGRIGHADVFTTPSTGIQFDPCGDVPTFATAAPGYRVIEFSGSAWSTHVVRLPEAKYVPSSD
ncbi:MAG: hypothetical protein KDA85_10505, partial [Planctomycetaceae bacterium]|nr:hypothetical protein [Planctomycetaceae bacterium]